MTNHPSFDLLRQQHIDSLNIDVYEFKHRATGAMHYHLAADNEENVFLVGLRTVPVDSTGVAHILEHTALCGSKNFPVRDPFFMMIRRSLNTFMNAFTSSDWTAYPFASQNKKDFNNLLDVYLDAVFFSRLDELDFRQEGHRLEFSTPNDPNSELLFKGVVFNEMKGAMSSPTSVLWQQTTSHLFPTSTYHFNSGGEPENIPDLSYDELKRFYKKHYHPSNAIFMTFGNIPAAEHQAKFEEKVLSHFQASDATVSIGKEQRFTQPLRIEEEYALDKSDASGDKTHIVMAWLLSESADLTELFQAHLLSMVLLDNSASPLLKALETTKLGSSPSPLCGLEDSNREMTFMCGLEGSKPENADALETLIFEVLQQVANDGISEDEVEAALHQLELNQREIGGSSYPYGLQLILAALSPAVHRGDPLAILDIDPVLAKLRQDIKDPDFIKGLVQKLLLNNKHMVRLVLKPNTELGQEQTAAEKNRLAAIKAGLSDAEKQSIVELADKLEKRQNLVEDMDILPKVTIDDIPKKMHFAQGEKIENSVNFDFYAQGTNGLIYQDIIYELPEIDSDLLKHVPHYTGCLTELACGEKSYLDMQKWQSSVSGGISGYTTIRNAIGDEQQLAGRFVFSGKALVRNHEQLCDLMTTTLNELRFDELDRIRELTAQFSAGQQQKITGSGHSLAMLAACSGMSPLAKLSHETQGLAGISQLKQLDKRLDDRKALSALAEQMQAIHHAYTATPHKLLVIAEGEQLGAIKNTVSGLKTHLPTAREFSAIHFEPIRECVSQMWVTSTQVNFCAKAFPSVPVDHPDCAAFTVLGPFLRNGFLHRVLREQGGAYGGGASQDNDIAAFRFYSYRDPRLTGTLDDFDKSLEWLASEKHSEQQLEEAILGVVSSIDKPASPAGEARKTHYNQLFGRTNEKREQFRQAILNITLGDLQRVADKYLQAQYASVAVVTSSNVKEQVGDLGMEVFTV